MLSYYYSKLYFIFFFEKKIKFIINLIKILLNFKEMIKIILFYIDYLKLKFKSEYIINIKIYFTKKVKNIIFIIKNILFIIKWFLISFFIMLLYIHTYIFYMQIDELKQLIIWFYFILLVYFIINIFNNIIVKLFVGKFITSIQRFWKKNSYYFLNYRNIFIFIIFLLFFK